jgi:hypothetical protein
LFTLEACHRLASNEEQKENTKKKREISKAVENVGHKAEFETSGNSSHIHDGFLLDVCRRLTDHNAEQYEWRRTHSRQTT